MEVALECPSISERERRYSRLRGLMEEAGFDVLVVVGRDGSGTRGDLRYVGAYGPVAPFLHFAVFPKEDCEPVFISRLPSRNPLAVEHGWIKDARVVWLGTEDAIVDQVAEFKGQGYVGVARIDTIPVPLYEKLVHRFGKERVHDAAHLMEQARLIKSAEEINFLRRAGEASDSAYIFLKDFVKPGCSDRAAYGQARRIMHEMGAEYSMDLISCGRGSFAPIGDVVDKDGYLAAEITPAYVGYYNQLRFELRFGLAGVKRGPAVDALRVAYEAGVSAIKPGVTSSELYDVTYDHIRQQGFDVGGGHFGHGTGLDVSEGISIEPGDDIELATGMHFVFHPKIMTPEHEQILLGGSFVVTQDGYESMNSVGLF